jgi:hypothetical protein
LTPNDFWTATAHVNFDGQGTFSGRSVYSINNGAPDPDNPSEMTGGTYTVSSDCTVTLTYTWEGAIYTDHGVVVGADGSEVIANEYGSGLNTTGHLEVKKVGDAD